MTGKSPCVRPSFEMDFWPRICEFCALCPRPLGWLYRRPLLTPPTQFVASFCPQSTNRTEICQNMIKFASLLVVVAIANAAPGGIQVQKSFQASAGGGAVAGAHAEGALFAGASAGLASSAGIAGSAGLASSAGIAGSAGSVGIAEASAEYGHKTIHHDTQILSEKSYTEAPKVISEKTIQEAPVVHRTVIEKTVIPQYVEKTIQEHGYVEKTIRVPTVVEHKVRVPVTPRVVEKTYDEGATVQKSASASVSSGVNVHKVGLVARPAVTVQKQYSRPGGLFGGVFANFGAGAAGGAGGSAYAAKSAAASAGASSDFHASVNAYKSPTLFNDIFSIPVATLGAVNNLLNGITRGASGHVAVSKTYY